MYKQNRKIQLYFLTFVHCNWPELKVQAGQTGRLWVPFSVQLLLADSWQTYTKKCSKVKGNVGVCFMLATTAASSRASILHSSLHSLSLTANCVSLYRALCFCQSVRHRGHQFLLSTQAANDEDENERQREREEKYKEKVYSCL